MLKTPFDLDARLDMALKNVTSLKMSLQQCADKYKKWADFRAINKNYGDMSDHEVWLFERTLGLGGSDIGALLGVSPYTTRHELWLDKAKMVVTFTGNNFSKWGSLLEQVIAENCAKTYGLDIKLSPPAFRPEVMQWLPANIDFDVPGTRLIGEVKTADANTSEKWGNGIPLDLDLVKGDLGSFAIDDINECLFPETYFCQMQDYLMLTGKEYCILTVLIGGNDERSYIIKANEKFQTLIRLEATYFMMYNVIDNNPPLLTSFELMAQHVACDFSGQVETNQDITELVDQLLEVKQSLKSLEEDKKTLETEIKMFIGEKEELVNESRDPIAVWTGYDKTTVDREALEDLYPDIYEEVKQVNQVRSLRIKRKLK